MITKELEVELTELKLHGELQMDLQEVGEVTARLEVRLGEHNSSLPIWKSTYLVYTVQELQEDGREATALPSQRVGPTVAETMAEGQPLFFH